VVVKYRVTHGWKKYPPRTCLDSGRIWVPPTGKKSFPYPNCHPYRTTSSSPSSPFNSCTSRFSSLPGSSSSIQSTSVSGPDAAARLGREVREHGNANEARRAVLFHGSFLKGEESRYEKELREAGGGGHGGAAHPLLISQCSAVPQLPRTDSCHGEEGAAREKKLRRAHDE
jgi:hypothetical protein